MPGVRQHSSNCGMPCFVNVFRTFQGTRDQPDKHPCVICRSVADIFSNITICDIRWPGILVTEENALVSCVGCIYDWHNCRSSWKLILCTPPLIAPAHHAAGWMTLRVSGTHQVEIEACLQWVMCQKELDTFDKIPVVECSEDEGMIFDQVSLRSPKLNSVGSSSKAFTDRYDLTLKLSSLCLTC
jgi:hypothetical protein